MGQDEQGLPAAGQATPSGTDPTAVTCEKTGEVLQGAAGQIDAGRVDKHAKAPGGLVILVVNPSTRSFLHARRQGRPSNHPSGWLRLTATTQYRVNTGRPAMSAWKRICTRAAVGAAVATVLIYFGGLWLTSSLSRATAIDRCLLKVGFENGPPSSAPVDLSTTYFPVGAACHWTGYGRVEVTTPGVNSLATGLLSFTALTTAAAVPLHLSSRRRQKHGAKPPGGTTGS